MANAILKETLAYRLKERRSAMLTITDIKNAVNKIAPLYPISRVHLFGSYADGNAKPNSDVDVLVEFKERPVNGDKY